MSFRQLQIYKISAIQRNKTNTILLFIATEHLDPVAREPAAIFGEVNSTQPHSLNNPIHITSATLRDGKAKGSADVFG